jgi:hypothetical protein
MSYQLRSGVIYVRCIICKREFPRNHTNYLFSDESNGYCHEIRVCYRCDT